MSDCRWTAKPTSYITNTKFNSAFHPSGVVPACLANDNARRVHLYWKRCADTSSRDS